MEPLPLQKGEIIVEPIDEVRLEKIKRRIPNRQGVWEVDYFYYPNPIQEKKDRPYYPYITLWVDQHSGFILSHHLDKPAECMSEFQRNFFKLAEKRKFFPGKYWLKKKKPSNYLSLLLQNLELI